MIERCHKCGAPVAYTGGECWCGRGESGPQASFAVRRWETRVRMIWLALVPYIKDHSMECLIVVLRQVEDRAHAMCRDDVGLDPVVEGPGPR